MYAGTIRERCATYRSALRSTTAYAEQLLRVRPPESFGAYLIAGVPEELDAGPPGEILSDPRMREDSTTLQSTLCRAAQSPYAWEAPTQPLRASRPISPAPRAVAWLSRLAEYNVSVGAYSACGEIPWTQDGNSLAARIQPLLAELDRAQVRLTR